MGETLLAGFQSRTDRLLAHDPLGDGLRRAVLREMRAQIRAAHTQPDEYHGTAHAIAIARHCLLIARQLAKVLDPDFTASELLVLEVAALLHDVGYAAYEPTWDANRRQHVKASLDYAGRALGQSSYLAGQARLTQSICYLIAHHDDTSYKFPSAVWHGGVGRIELDAHAAPLAEFEASLPEAQRLRLRLLLGILREADALSAAGPQGAARTFGYSAGRGLPIFSQGNPLDAWSWEESAVGNTRLAAKRALIDACTAAGRRRARSFYRATEAYIEAICARDGVEYTPEQLAPALDSDALDSDALDGATLDGATLDGATLDGDAFDGDALECWSASALADSLEITRFTAWPKELAALQSTSRLPESAVMERGTRLRRLPIAQAPKPNLPAPEATIGFLRGLEQALQREYALSLFDLTGSIDLRWRGDTYRLRVPVVAHEPYLRESHGQEAHRREAEHDQYGAWLDLDGAARIHLARRLGASAIWAVDLCVSHR